LETTDSDGKYLLLTTVQQVSKVQEWIDKNIEEMFIEYLPQYCNFSPVEGYDYPKCGDKPHFSSQLGTYADKLWLLYPRTSDNATAQTNKWNQLPLHKNCHNTNGTLIFDTDKYPTLSKSNPKCTQQGDPQLQSHSPNPAPTYLPWHKKSETKSSRT